MISRATMLMILMSGLTAGPAVSLYGSPTVSPVTAALWASEPLPPKCPSSMYFLALSQAPPPVHIEIAMNRPVTMVPMSTPPSACGPRTSPTTIGTSTGSSDGIIISLIAASVSMSTAAPYSGFALPSMMPGISLNWRRTSTTTEAAAHFHHHRGRGAAHRFHRHRGEQERHHAADQEADDHHVVGEVEGERLAR